MQDAINAVYLMTLVNVTHDSLVGISKEQPTKLVRRLDKLDMYRMTQPGHEMKSPDTLTA